MSSDGISISITEDVTKVEVTEDVTTINITPSVTTVEAKGISIANASAATAVTYQGTSNTLGTGGNVAASLDHINTNGFNKNANNTIDGNTTIAYDHTLNFTSGSPVYNAMNLGNNNITGINHIAFADAGAGEGLRWQNIEIVETDDALTANSPGDLQVTYKQSDNSYARRFTVRDTGVDVVGTITFDGGTTSADLDFATNARARFGEGQQLQIYSDGTTSYIDENGSGNLLIRGNNLHLQKYTGANYLTAVADGATTLFHNGNTKIATTANGAAVTGDLMVESTDGVQSSLDLKNSEGQFRIINDAGELSIYDQTDTTERLRIDTSGNVGIGTNDPRHTLHVTGTQRVQGQMMIGNSDKANTIPTDVALHIKNDGLGARIRIEDKDSAPNSYWDMLVDRGDSFAIYEGTDERLTFKEGGNAGIGISDPTEKLDVSGNVKATQFKGDLLGTINTATTAATQSASDNSTKVATTAYVTTAVSNLVDGSPAALDTLNELAAALGDDASFSTTVTDSIGTKLAKASNLSDLANAGTARTNLGLGTAATINFDGAYSSLTNKPTLYTDAAVNTHLNQSTAGNNEVLSWNGTDYDWVAQSGGIALTDISVNGTEGTAEGDGGIGYDNTTGVFTYTPPDLSSYITSAPVSSVDGATGVVTTLQLGTTATTALAGNASIGDLSDVDGTISTSENSILAYNTATNKYTPHTVPGLQDDTKNQYIKVKAGGNGVVKGKPYCLIGWDTTDDIAVTELTDADGAGQMLCAGFGIETASAGTETKLLVQGLLTNVDTTFNNTATISSISSSNANASTGEIISDVAHNWETGYRVYATNFSDNLLLGLQSGTSYYARTSASNNGFVLYPTLNDALNNTNKITFTAAQVTAATGESFNFSAFDSGTLLYPGTGGGTLRRQPPVRGLNVVAQHVAEIILSHATQGVLYVNPGSPIERTQLQDGEVAYGGVNGEQKTTFTDLLKNSFPLKADMGYPQAPGGLVETNVISLIGASGAKDEILIGEMASQLDQITLQPGDGGVRIHRSTTSLEGTNQTLVFHTTDNGIHVGNDRRGTYTAGDLMQNADLDFGMLVGRESTNTGSNNFGFGYKHSFGTGTASNFAAGSLHSVSSASSYNNFMAGGDNKLSVSGSNNFCGGIRTDTRNSNNFTWAEGVVDGSAYYRAKNYGLNCALFGKQTEIDGNCTYSLVGGDVDSSYIPTTLASSHESVLWGESQTMSNCFSSISVGKGTTTNRVKHSAIFGENHSINSAATSGDLVGITVGGHAITVKGTSNECTAFGWTHTMEGAYTGAIGGLNNAIGIAGMCFGYNLKTPLFQPVVNVSGTLTEQGDYVWDNYSTVVGAFNDESHKYHTVYPTDGTVPTAWVTDHRFVVGTGADASSKANGFIVALPTDDFSGIIMPALAASNSHTNGADAKADGVPVGGLYHTNGVVKVVLDSD